MKYTVVCLVVGTLCLLCSESVNGTENEVTEYERSGSCSFTQECLYKYRTVQHTLGEKDRETISFSTDVHWHCESSGSFGTLLANEYCFTLSNTNVTTSSSLNLSASIHYTTNGHDRMAGILRDKLKGEFCYVQTRDGKIVSIHYSPTESEEGINVKRGITGAFQANFENQEQVEESDPGSTHISHYSFLKTSSNVISFTRAFETSDLIEVTGGAPKGSLSYTKTEKSTFINRVLYKSRGMLKSRIELGRNQTSEPSSNTSNPNLDFGKEFEANGTYVLEKVYCKQKSKRSLAFANLESSNIKKGFLKATIDLANLHRHKMRKIRSAIPSIPGFLEKIRRNPGNIELVETLYKLLKLEAIYGTPSQFTSTIDQLINYYKQIQASNKVEDIEIRKILYALFSVDSSPRSQKVLGSALKKHLTEDERSVLLHQLMLIKNTSLDLVNTVISSIASNDDGIILVLGALARNSNFAIQKVVIDELLQRLNTVLPSSSNNEVVIALIYALGNSGSKLAVSPLLSTLQYDDIDIQISAIRSLASHLDQPVVQQAIITLLPLTDEDIILEEILKILIDAFENKILTNPSEEMINAIINSAIQLENPNLYELVAIYLHQLKIDEIDIYLDVLKQQHNYGDLQHEHIGDMDNNHSRIKRGSDWDEYDTDYNIVSSYTNRKNDVKNYPKHTAYIFGKTFGVSNLNVKIGAGGFAGMEVKSSSANYKVFAKAAANVNVFGRRYKLLDLELSRYTSNNYIYDTIWLWDGSSLNKHTKAKAEPLCIKKKFSHSGSLRVFDTDIKIYLYVGYIYADISATVSSGGMDVGLCTCFTFPPISQPTARCNADVKLYFTLRVSGDTYTSLLDIYRVGIEVSSTFSYALYPDLRVEASASLPDIFSSDEDKCINSLVDINNCVYLHHSWDVYGRIYPWYQKKKVRVSWSGISTSWGSKTRWDRLYDYWKTSSGKRHLWSYCPKSVKSCLT